MRQSAVLPGGPFELTLIRLVQARHSELLFVDDVRRPGATLVIKRIVRSRSPDVARATLLREFAALERLHAEPGLRDAVPTPVHVLPEEFSIVMGHLSGRPLLSILRRCANRFAAGGRSQLFILGRAIGSSLAELHTLTSGSRRPFDSGPYLLRLQRDIERCDRRLLGIDKSGLLETATEMAQGLEGESLPVAARHGDFVPQNVLIDAGPNVRLVDFENFVDEAPVYEDLAAFVGYARSMAFSPWYSRRRLSCFIKGFLDGYDSALNQSVLDKFLLGALLAQAADSRLSTRHRIFPVYPTAIRQQVALVLFSGRSRSGS